MRSQKWLVPIVAALLAGPGLAAAAEESQLVADARANLTRLFEALRSGSPEAVRPWLAPEFQVMRSDGVGYERESYLAKSIPRIAAAPRFEGLVATRNLDLVVVRVWLLVDETIDGRRARSGSPQLFVFRVGRVGWQVVAAANFAPLENPPNPTR